MQLANLPRARGLDHLGLRRHLPERVLARVVHRGRQRHRRGQEGLHLVEAEVVLLQPQRQVEHVLVGRARVGCDEVRHQVLLLARQRRELLEHLAEFLVGTDARLHHLGERVLLGVLGRDLEQAADVVGDELLHVLRRAHRQVVAQARADGDALDARHRARLAVQLDQRGMVGVEILADARIHARQPPAVLLDRLALAHHAVHVGRRPAEVGDVALEVGRLVADLLDLVNDRRVRAALDDAALVLGDRAEGAAAEAAAHDVDRELDHVPGRDARAAVARVRRPREGPVEHEVHLGRGQRHRRRVDPHVARAGAFAVALHHRARVARVGLEVEHARGVGVHHRVFLDLFVRRQADQGVCAVSAARGEALGRRHDAHRLGAVGGRLGRGGGRLHGVGVGMRIDAAGLVQRQRIQLVPFVRRPPARLDHEGGAAQVADGLDRLARGQTVGQRHQRTLGVAKQQDVGLGVGQHRTSHLVRPVVVVCDPAQAGLDAADDDRRAGVGLARTLRIHRHRAIRAFARLGVGRVGVFRADLAVGRIAVDQRVHVPGGDAEIQPRLAQRTKRLGRLPVGLAEDANAKTVRLEQPPDQRHAEARVVDVGVAGDEDDVAFVPAERVHFLARHGKERRGAVPGNGTGQQAGGGRRGRRGRCG